MRLVDADALLEAIKADRYTNAQDAIFFITNAPTVRREGWVSDERRMDYLSNGGWEVLQDPKYWTDELNVRQVIDRNIAAPVKE